MFTNLTLLRPYDKSKYPYQNVNPGNIKGELGKDVPGVEDYYFVLNYGRIKDCNMECTKRFFSLVGGLKIGDTVVVKACCSR